MASEHPKSSCQYEWNTEQVTEKQNIFKKHQKLSRKCFCPKIGQNWSVWSHQKHNFPNGQVHSKTDPEQNQLLTSTQPRVKKQKIATLFFTCKNLCLLFYYYFNAEAVVPVLIIWLNELKWDSPGSCWHNEWLCGEAQNVNDEEFWKALEFVNNKSSYSPQNLTICSQQQRRTQRPLFNKMIQKQDTKGIRGYLYWHNTASKLCPQVGRVMNAFCEHIVNWITTVLFLLSLFQHCYHVSCVSNSQGLRAFQPRLCKRGAAYSTGDFGPPVCKG